MPPKRFKDPGEMTVAEHAEHQRTGTVPETDEYREAVKDALDDAGLEPTDDELKDIEDMTPDDHFKQIKRPPDTRRSDR
jgi:hypothetical protein